jgi:hypothetical protein
MSNTGIFGRILRGYVSVFNGALRLTLFLLSLAVLSLVFTFPLWYWAVHGAESFTLVMVLAVTAVVIFLIFHRISAAIKQKRTAGLSSVQIILTPLKKLGSFLLLLVLLYGVMSLFSAGRPALSLLFAIAAVLLLGLVFFRGN